MVRSAAALLLVVSLSFTFAQDNAPAKPEALKFVSEFEGGKLHRAGLVSVLELKGNYRQMGRQYGALLKDQLVALYGAAIEQFFIVEKKFPRERMTTIATMVHDSYPKRYKEVLDTPLDKGGATVEGTIYQVIAVPAEKKIWLKVPGQQNWTEIALEPFFKSK